MNPLSTNIFTSNLGFKGNDFNEFVTALESHGSGTEGSLGNVVGCLWKVKDTVELDVTEYRIDPHLFVKNGVDYTLLVYGVMTNELDNEKVVVDTLLSAM